MRGERRRLNLSFTMESERQRAAWEALSVIPRGQRTEAVCNMICSYMTQSELLSAVREAIRDELSRGTWPERRNMQREQAGDVGDDVLGFLSALQEEEDD